MALYTIHYALFTVSKLANPHLLLRESYQVIWRPEVRYEYPEAGQRSSPQEFEDFEGITKNTSTDLIRQNSTRLPIAVARRSSPSDDTALEHEFNFVYSVLFIMSLTAFLLGSLRSLPKTDRTKEHRRQLINSLAYALSFNLVYLYAINTLAGNYLNLSSSFLFRFIHTAFLIVFITGAQWACLIINSIGDPLTINFCFQNSKYKGIHYQFITHLVIGALSLVIGSVCQCGIFNICRNIYGDQLNFTNTVLLTSFVCLSCEFVCVCLFSTSEQESENLTTGIVSDKKELDSRKSLDTKFPLIHYFSPKKTRLVIDYEVSTNGYSGKAIYSLNDNSSNITSNIMTISSGRLGRYDKGEIVRAADEDEFVNYGDTSYHTYPDLCQTKPSGQEINKVKHSNIDDSNDEVDLYDRSKFSLYEDFSHKIKANRSTQLKSPPVSLYGTVVERSEMRQRSYDQRNCILGTLDILISRDLNFTLDSLMIVALGSIYQANQICFFADYLNYLLNRSPIDFRRELFSSLQSFNEAHDFDGGLETGSMSSLWMELICISYLVQSLTRVVGLNYVNKLVLRLGHRKLLAALTIFSLSIPVHFYINYCLIEDHIGGPSFFSNGVRTVAIAMHLVIVQLQIGLIGGLSDFLINDLALKYAQQVANYRSSTLLVGELNKSAHCTIHGTLSGLFNLVGMALMSAVIILVNSIASRNSQHSRIESLFISIWPALIFILLSLRFYYRRRKLLTQIGSFKDSSAGL